MKENLKKNLRLLIITSIVVLLPLIVGLALWSRLPAELPTHFNAYGVADRYDSRAFTVIGLPLMLLSIHLFCVLLSMKDFDKAGSKMVHVVFWLIPVLTVLTMSGIYAKAFNVDINMGFIVILSISLITIIMGNYLPKIKQNTTIGIRIPSTFRSEENWYRTHRFTGKLWVITGIIMIVVSFTKINLGYAALTWLGIDILAPIIYSLSISKKTEEKYDGKEE